MVDVPVLPSRASGPDASTAAARSRSSARTDVAVVIITRNRRQELLAVLGRLDRDGRRIVVVDNGSDDGTSEAVVARHPRVVLLRPGRNLGSAGRNLGVVLAGTPYVAFADDDSWWEPGALASAADALDRHPRLAVVAAEVLVGPAREVDPVCTAMAASPLPPEDDLPGPSILGFVACGAVVRTSAFLAVGGFEQLLGVGGEEELLTLDLAADGWGLAYLDAVVAVHEPSPSRDRTARRRRVLRNQLLVAWLRRRWRAALTATVAVARASVADAAARGALIEALRLAPEVWRRRRPIPVELESRVAMLERSDRSGAGGALPVR